MLSPSKRSPHEPSLETAGMGKSKLTPRQQRFVDEYLIDTERFWSYVDRSCHDQACWPWIGCRDEKGYGRFHVGESRNSSKLAHRIAFGIATGEHPEAVCHTCDNPSCCNPAHLFGGTKADNNHDMMKKGRHWLQVAPERAIKGEAHGSAKLTDGIVREIRRVYALGAATQRDLARQHGVSQRSINKVVRHIGWDHVQ